MNYKCTELGSTSTSDLIDSRLEEQRIGTSNHCPSCGQKLGGRPDWLGLPAGVKFDPTDQELIEHLEGKVEVNKDMKSHPLIDEFIPTIEGEDGICYTHPEKLPGVTRDGLSRHFFHRPSKAYTTGTRKRRKIHTDHECHDLQGINVSTTTSGETRWHKTGKTRPVMVNGKQKGCKKILVLYTNFGKNRKPEKTNWVMHQYHLGLHEEEKEGELVVSKIFYQTQPRQCNWSADRGVAMVAGDGISDLSCKRESGSTGSCSSMEIVAQRQEEFSGCGVPNMSSSYNAMELQQLKPEHFSFPPFRRSFDEVEVGEASTPREAPATSSTSENVPEHQNVHLMAQEYQQYHHHHHHHQPDPIHHHIATAANFHINRPSNPVVSTIVPPPLHHTSINLLEEDPYHVSRIMLQNQLQEQQQQQHHKIGRMSATGLEEVIMQCTSSTDLKEESSVTHPQVTDPWIKYSSFWNDHPDNPDHHHL